MTRDRSGGVAVRAESQHLHASFSFYVNVGSFSQSVTFTSPSLFAVEESLQAFGLSVYHKDVEVLWLPAPGTGTECPRASGF